MLCPILRCALSSSELEVSSHHQGLRSRTQGTKALVGRKGERTIATTATTSRTMASAQMSSQILNMAVGRWPLSRMKKIKGLQEAVRS